MPGIVTHLFLIFLIITLGLTFKSSTSARGFIFAVALIIYISGLFSPYADAGTNASERYFVGFSGIFLLARAVDILFLHKNPQDTINHNKQVIPASQLSLVQRFKWATTLLINVRGANWNCAIPGLRYPEPSSRRRFIFSQLLWMGYYYVLGEVFSIYERRNPAFHGQHGESFGARGPLWQCANVLVYWTTTVTTLNSTHLAISVALVTLRLSDPEDWPPLFGVWSEATSVRAFWGKCWHQGLRRSLQPQSKYIANNLLNFKPGSKKSSYTQLFTCFLLSGVYHALGDWFAMRNLSSAKNNVKFFLLQAACITLEDFIIFLGKQVGFKRVPKVFSYAWVVAWLTYSSPMWMETMIVVFK